MARSGKGSAIAITVTLTVVALIGIGVAASSAKTKPGPKDPEDKPEDKPVDKPDDKPDDKPADPNADPNALEFDLTDNWGVIPLSLRIWLARIELAAQIPGIARALAVKAWQAFRAGQAYVDLATAADIASKNPELCRLCFNPGDGPDSKVQLDKAIKAGRPTPKDYAGWASGSFGLFDILGATAVYAGDQTGTPRLLNLEAAPTMRRFDAQGYAAASIIRQFLFSEKYPVLKPGPNAANGDSRATWGNIFGAWAKPDAFSKGQAGPEIDRYVKRAAECGIDLAKVAYPWPPGQKYDAKNWSSNQVWTRLQEYKDRPVNDLGGVVVPQPEPLPDIDEEQKVPPKMGLLLNLVGGLKAAPLLQVADDKTPAPLVVVLHGREGDEKQLAGFVPVELGARIFFLRGNIPGPGGTWSFFAPRLSDPDDILLPAMKTALGNVLAALAELQAKYPTTRVLVLGGSQGGALAYALAAAGAVDGAIAVSGMLPAALRPTRPAASVVVGVHGTADKVVPYASGQATLDAFTAAGFLFTQWISKQGGGHALTQAAPDVRQVLVDLAGDEYIPDEVGLALTQACQIVVPAPADATWSISTRLVSLARELRQQRGKPLPRVDLDTLLLALIVELAPFCANGPGIEFADQTAARDGYQVLRAALRAVQARGLLAPGVAAQVLGDLKAQAQTLGVPAASLPPLDL